jgi:hypothetical protein
LGVSTQRARRPRQLLVGILTAAPHVLTEQLEGIPDVIEKLLDAGDPALDLTAGNG